MTQRAGKKVPWAILISLEPGKMDSAHVGQYGKLFCRMALSSGNRVPATTG
jgi:hypothetical protein